MKRIFVATLIASLFAMTGVVVPAQASTGAVLLASINAAGAKGNDNSGNFNGLMLSGDGTKVVFETGATNLSSADSDTHRDIYLKDLASGALTLVSTSASGLKGNGRSVAPAISADGTKVAFQSDASNLHPADTDSTPDIYVKDLATGALTLASTNASGLKGTGRLPTLSADGSKVAFDGFLPGSNTFFLQVYVKDLTNGAVTVASRNGSGQLGDVGASSASLAGDGTKVAFASHSTNLHPADTTTDLDVYVKDLDTGNLILASATGSGAKSNGSSNWGPRLSLNGAKVAFSSNATNLHGSDNDTGYDIYVKDLVTGDLTLGSTTGVGRKGNDNSWQPSLSADATTLAFVSFSSNLLPADPDAGGDIYVKDLTSGALTLASTNASGVKGSNSSGYDTSLDSSGSRVAFASHASNLHPGDLDFHADVYVKELQSTNARPVVDAGVPVAGAEGSALSLDAAVTDLDVGDTVTTAWSVPSTAPCSFADPAAVDTTITCSDDGTYTATLTANDGVNADVTDSVTITVSNAAPVATITAPASDSLHALGTAVNVSASFTDTGDGDIHTCSIDWGDGATPGAGSVNETSGDGTCSASHTYAAAGLYSISATITDDDTGSDTETVGIVVYDPSGGFVTGAGGFDSPSGAYTPQDPTDPDVTGRARFRFVSKYQKGATAPIGNTGFDFQTAGLSFESESYSWLVVSGPKAQFKGSGAVNGATGYGFLLTANDGQVVGGGGVDKFRIKIWDKATGVVIYDNQPADSEGAAATTAISGGQIMVQKK